MPKTQYAVLYRNEYIQFFQQKYLAESAADELSWTTQDVVHVETVQGKRVVYTTYRGRQSHPK